MSISDSSGSHSTLKKMILLKWWEGKASWFFCKEAKIEL
jgi:hypothetical protein